MTDAHSLPDNSIVATEDRCWIKRSTAPRHPPRTPFYEEWWIEATVYAIQIPNHGIQELLNSGEAHVLRLADVADTTATKP